MFPYVMHDGKFLIVANIRRRVEILACYVFRNLSNLGYFHQQSTPVDVMDELFQQSVSIYFPDMSVMFKKSRYYGLMRNYVCKRAFVLMDEYCEDCEK